MDNILYTTLDEEAVFELEEKRSVFIGYAISVSNEEQAKEYIQKIKAKHHDARHNCSAYLLRNGAMRYSDDGEPQGTAGIPILEVIKKSGIVDVAVVVPADYVPHYVMVPFVQDPCLVGTYAGIWGAEEV